MVVIMFVRILPQSKSHMDRIAIEEEEEFDIFYSPENFEDKNDKEIGEYDHVEKKKIDYLRERVEEQDSDCKNVDDLTLRRFLRARDLDSEKAYAMYTKYLAWRRTFVPEGSISASEVPNQIAHSKVFMQGKNKRGCPVVVIFGAKHFPYNGGTQEFKRFVAFVLDKVCSRIPEGEEKFTIIIDLKGFGYSNVDIQAFVAGLPILQDYYPERLEKVFLIHAPFVFMATWKIIYPFIDKNTKKKVVFVEKKKLQDTLLEEIEENQLPEIYGGKLKLVPIQDV